jgi:hypothetical protein
MAELSPIRARVPEPRAASAALCPRSGAEEPLDLAQPRGKGVDVRP